MRSTASQELKTGNAMRICYLTLVLFAIQVPPASAVVLVWVDVPEDVWEYRTELEQLPAVQLQREQLAKLAYLIISDPDLQIENSEKPAPFNRQRIALGQIEDNLGPSGNFDKRLFARPVSSEPLFELEGLELEDRKGLTGRSRFYHRAGVGGVFVFYDSDGEAMAPAIIYFELDEEFPKLTDLGEVETRLKWEEAKLAELSQWLTAHSARR